MKVFTLTLTVALDEDASGREEEIGNCVDDAVRNRLFGEGFLPDDITVDTYNTLVEWSD